MSTPPSVHCVKCGELIPLGAPYCRRCGAYQFERPARSDLVTGGTFTFRQVGRGSTVSATIAFQTPYSATPMVMASCDHLDVSLGVIPTTTGFTLLVKNNSNLDLPSVVITYIIVP